MFKAVMWVVDWVGRVQTAIWVKIICGGLVLSILGALQQATGLQILGLFVCGALLSLGGLIAWQNYKATKPAEPPQLPLQHRSQPHSTMSKDRAYDPAKDEHQEEIYFQSGFDPSKPSVEIEFIEDAGQRYSTWEKETENGKQVNVQRHSILLKNTSESDLENVTVKLEDVVEEGAGTTYLGYELPLESPSRRIRKKDKAWVRVISYRKQEGPYWISIEGADKDAASKEGKLFHPHNRRELHLAVRADGGIYLPSQFQCWVDDQGCLRMRRLSA